MRGAEDGESADRAPPHRNPLRPSGRRGTDPRSGRVRWRLCSDRPNLNLGADAPNAEGLRVDARRERLALFGLSLPALLLVIVTMVIPVGWLF